VKESAGLSTISGLRQGPPCGMAWRNTAQVQMIMLSRALMLALAFGVLAVGAMSVATIRANGGDVDSGEQPLSHVGPYLVSISPGSIRPYVGEEVVIVTVLDAANSEPVPGAKVIIRTRNETKGTKGFALALNSPATPQWFKAAVILDTPGVWQLTAEISSALGEVAVDLPSVQIINAQPRALSGLLVYGLVLAAIVGGGTYLWRSSRSAIRQRDAAS
jgi:hypothetical protein